MVAGGLVRNTSVVQSSRGSKQGLFFDLHEQMDRLGTEKAVLCINLFKIGF